jgi:hypothetical protein
MILIIHLRQLEITEWGIANLLYLLRFQHADMPMLSTNDNITVASYPFSWEIPVKSNENRTQCGSSLG